MLFLFTSRDKMRCRYGFMEGRQNMKTEEKSGRAKNSLLSVHEEGVDGSSWE